MRINTGIINGLSIYYSYLLREPPKPVCNIPSILVNDPKIFENTVLCTNCSCKITCRYSLPPDKTRLRPAKVSIPLLKLDDINYLPSSHEKNMYPLPRRYDYVVAQKNN
jgi:hypothetical protein